MLPLLVMVSGKPGAGKSPLAQRFAAEDSLWLPVVSCDPFRNGLRASGAPSAGSAAIAVFYSTIDQLLNRGVSLIADLSFRRGLDEVQLLARSDRFQIVNIHCEVAVEIARHRFLARQQHRSVTGGASRITVEMMEGSFDWAVFEPLALSIPRLIVDTSDGYAPDLAVIVAFCRASRSVGDCRGGDD